MSVTDEAPGVVPFKPRIPPALEHWERPYLVDGVLLQWIGERWRVEDLWACPYEAEADPAQPGTAIVMRIVSLTSGRSFSPLTDRELESLRACLRVASADEGTGQTGGSGASAGSTAG